MSSNAAFSRSLAGLLGDLLGVLEDLLCLAASLVENRLAERVGVVLRLPSSLGIAESHLDPLAPLLEHLHDAVKNEDLDDEEEEQEVERRDDDPERVDREPGGFRCNCLRRLRGAGSKGE